MVEENESMQVVAVPMVINSNLVVDEAILAYNDNLGDKFNEVWISSKRLMLNCKKLAWHGFLKKVI